MEVLEKQFQNRKCFALEKASTQLKDTRMKIVRDQVPQLFTGYQCKSKHPHQKHPWFRPGKENIFPSAWQNVAALLQQTPALHFFRLKTSGCDELICTIRSSCLKTIMWYSGTGLFVNRTGVLCGFVCYAKRELPRKSTGNKLWKNSPQNDLNGKPENLTMLCQY